MRSDVAFKERVLAIEDVAAMPEFIQNEGFHCTEKEIKEVSSELSDEDLLHEFTVVPRKGILRT